MKIGQNIREIRQAKELSPEYMSKKLGISVGLYEKIETNQTDITLSKLEEIAQSLSCSPVYIIRYKESSGSIYNHFENKEGNQGVNINFQGFDPDQIRKIYQEELSRIPKLEKLLRTHKIEFDF